MTTILVLTSHHGLEMIHNDWWRRMQIQRFREWGSEPVLQRAGGPTPARDRGDPGPCVWPLAKCEYPSSALQVMRWPSAEYRYVLLLLLKTHPQAGAQSMVDRSQCPYIRSDKHLASPPGSLEWFINAITLSPCQTFMNWFLLCL